MHRYYTWVLNSGERQEEILTGGNQDHDLQEQAWTQCLVNLERESSNKLYFQRRL